MDPISGGSVSLAVTTATLVIFGPYLTKDNLICNSNSSWACYCSLSSSTVDLKVPKCVDTFEHAEVVVVDFRDCDLNLGKEVAPNVTYEDYLKNYFVSWIREECAMSPCRGYRGRDTRIRISFVLLACSNEGNTRLMMNAVQENYSSSSNTTVPEYVPIPAETFARILSDRYHMLQYYLGSEILDVVVSRVPKYTSQADTVTADDMVEDQGIIDSSNSSYNSTSPFRVNSTALVVGCVLAVYFVSVVVLALLLIIR